MHYYALDVFKPCNHLNTLNVKSVDFYKSGFLFVLFLKCFANLVFEKNRNDESVEGQRTASDGEIKGDRKQAAEFERE